MVAEVLVLRQQPEERRAEPGEGERAPYGPVGGGPPAAVARDRPRAQRRQEQRQPAGPREAGERRGQAGAGAGGRERGVGPDEPLLDRQVVVQAACGGHPSSCEQARQGETGERRERGAGESAPTAPVDSNREPPPEEREGGEHGGDLIGDGDSRRQPASE